ncbi:MAG: hypothetical protein HY537_08015 [Deltaproteobacteria bacterium]|nr:hypothetical protein [Deltaproteobacteria bacterium]
MKIRKRNKLGRQFRNLFRLVPVREKHQRPELIDKANEIIGAFKRAEPKHRRSLQAFEPLKHENHPSLAAFDCEKTNPLPCT